MAEVYLTICRLTRLKISFHFKCSVYLNQNLKLLNELYIYNEIIKNNNIYIKQYDIEHKNYKQDSKWTQQHKIIPKVKKFKS